MVTHGDEALAATLRERMGPRHRTFAAARVSSQEAVVASVGAPPEADFEIGSISKGITGMLYVDALERGEVGPSSTLGEFLPLGDTPAASLPLATISTHRSGLPRLSASIALVLWRTLALRLTGANPYGDSLEQLIAQARRVRPKEPRALYSNFGFELLGHAVARAAGTSYEDLVRERIATPLGLTCYVPATPDQLRPGALVGTNESGRKQQPWTGEAIGPAGGIRASIQDMARLAAALLDGTAPGVAALEPVAEFGEATVRIGAAWITVEHDGRDVTWHNGGTGGFHTWLGLDRAAGTAVVVMSATAISVDQYGFDLL